MRVTTAWTIVALAVAASVAQPIRSHHARIAHAVNEAARASATFRALLARLSGSHVIVYVESGQCPNAQVGSCIAVRAGADSYRYLWVTVDTRQTLPILISEIAHELQHAVEIANAPDVVDHRTLRDLYARIGAPSVSADVFETTNAIAVAARVSLEVSSHRTVSTVPPRDGQK